MSEWTVRRVKAVLGGDWLARGPDETPIAGLCIDSRVLKRGQIFAALRGTSTDGHRYLGQAARAGASLALVDAPETLEESVLGQRAMGVLHVKNVEAAMLKLAAAYRQSLERTKVIAVAGSNGKTTTVRLIHAVLSQGMRGTPSPKSFNNALGVPLTILAAKHTDQFLICEVGTNAPGEIAPLAAAIRPDIAVITSIGREHLEGLGTLEGVAREEASILAELAPGGIGIVTADSPELESLLAKPGTPPLVRFGVNPKADLRVSETRSLPEGLEFCLNDREQYRLPMLGRHNALNAAAAVAVAKRMGLEHEAIAAALSKARGPEMRLEHRAVGTITFLNDAYNANPESTLAALATLAEIPPRPGSRRVVVLGDMLELGTQAGEAHREIGRALAALAALDLAVFVGSMMRGAAEEFARLRPQSQSLVLDSPDDPALLQRLRPGDLVLLKGSRGMRLERAITACQSRPPTGSPSLARTSPADR